MPHRIGFIINLILLALACLIPVAAQDNACAELQKLIDKTYDFKPSKLTSEERTVKSGAMDVIWEIVKADQKRLVPCLKKALDKPDANNFFIFDGSNLLFSLDKSDETKKLLIRSYAAVDLEDVNQRYWMPSMARLGFEGFDTSAAAENWLKAADPGYYLPHHGLRPVNKQIGALIIYGSMDEELATPALAKIAAQENHIAREIAVDLLIKQLTPKALQILQKLDKKGLSEKKTEKIELLLTDPKRLSPLFPREGKPRITREQHLKVFQELVDGKPESFMELAAEFPDGDTDLLAVMKPEDIPLIRRVRRYYAATATPHAADWYQSFTDILLVMIGEPATSGQK